MSIAQVESNSPKITNGHGYTLNNTQSEPKISCYTQGVGTDWYYELIHSSKNKIKKINDFMRPYETNGRDINPEVFPKSNGNRPLLRRNVKNWKGFFMKMILMYVLANLAHVTYILVLTENYVQSTHVLLTLSIRTITSNSILLPMTLTTLTNYLPSNQSTLSTQKLATKYSFNSPLD